MTINAQMAVSRSNLSSELSQNRSKLSNLNSSKKFDTEFRKAISRDRVRERPERTRSDNKTSQDQDRRGIEKDSASKDSLDKKDALNKTEKKGSQSVETEKTKSSENQEIISAVNQAYNNMDIDPEFLELLGRTDLEVEIDEENQEIIIHNMDSKRELVNGLGIDMGDLDKLSTINNNRINYGELDKLVEDSLQGFAGEEGIEKVGVNPELADQEGSFINPELGDKLTNPREDSGFKLEGLEIEENLEIDRLPLEDVDLDSDEDLDGAGKESEEEIEVNRLDSRFQGLDMRTIQTSMTDSKSELEALDKLFNSNIDNIEESIIGNIDTVVEGETTSMKVALYPRNLGSINIELTMENGKLLGKIMTEDASTKQMLTQNLAKLTESLMEQDIQISEIEISLNNNSSNWEGQDQEEGSTWENPSSQTSRARNLKMGNITSLDGLESVVPREINRGYPGSENLNILV